ncbi:hypothetical protein OQX61_23850 [Pedobacter sp. PLR]|uniref:hypothetical protein n=1 Tax=Pedobacter sp. PLR TaxID=2994465 RepID=UPI0022450421|nr:hypothetical protein [Pedobacter sp. PLR]MCX2454325.1 hypothetical protein [Pedobacter sp. PLR]
MKKILILLLLIIFGFMFHQEQALLKNSGYGIIDLELSKKEHGASIVSNWQQLYYGDQTLLSLARQNTHLDFLFIVVYVTLIMTLSNARMQREKALWLNELLRFNLFLAVLIGVLDIIENIRLLHSFHHAGNVVEFWPTCYLAWPKFALLVWVILVYAFSVVKSMFQR